MYRMSFTTEDTVPRLFFSLGQVPVCPDVMFCVNLDVLLQVVSLDEAPARENKLV